MRPPRFVDFVVDVVKNQPTARRVQTLADDGDSKHPCGVVITTVAGATRWQVVGQLPNVAKHAGFDDSPFIGTPAAAGAAPRPGDLPEAWLAAALAHAENPEIAGIERWSTRSGERDLRYGVTVRFHNGARIFVRQLG